MEWLYTREQQLEQLQRDLDQLQERLRADLPAGRLVDAHAWGAYRGLLLRDRDRLAERLAAMRGE